MSSLRFNCPVVVSLLVILLTASAPAATALRLIATTPDLASIAKEVGRDRVDVTALARPAEDAHFVDPKPSFMVKLNRADALIEGGVELEAAWLGSLLEGARNPKLAIGTPGRIRCSFGVRMLEVPQQADRSQGDIHASGNPHYVISPTNAKQVARNLADAFIRLSPDGRDDFERNLREFVGKLEAKIIEWKEALAPFAGQRIVAYHNSWPYFGEEFGLKFDLFLEPKPGIPPSPAHLARLIKTMNEEKVRLIFMDTYVNRKTAETVAASTGARILSVTQYPGGVKGTEGGYISLLDYLVFSLQKALQP